MSYKKALEELGISREINIERVEHLATEMDIKDPDDDVNILRKLYYLCNVSYSEFLMNHTWYNFYRMKVKVITMSRA